MSSDAEYARGMVEDEGVWGFIIYRCAYKSDEEWSRFLQVLNDNVRESLEAEDEEFLDLMDSLDWDVQNDPELENASKGEVRRSAYALVNRPYPKLIIYRRFQRWATEHSDLSSPRSNFCIMVDQDCIDATLSAPAPPDYDSEHKAFVYLIDRNWRPHFVDDTYGDSADGTDSAERELADEGFEPLDGCRMDDVGFVKLAVTHVAPRAFSVLDDPGWESVYRRPPVVVKP
ncbi:Hypothetical protein D9617_17g046710 [Elsinoe fawcettii]|nr:Hypothetical protein D9617_17g046710 [Elsinoe fawcettii]